MLGYRRGVPRCVSAVGGRLRWCRVEPPPLSRSALPCVSRYSQRQCWSTKIDEEHRNRLTRTRAARKRERIPPLQFPVRVPGANEQAIRAHDSGSPGDSSLEKTSPGSVGLWVNEFAGLARHPTMRRPKTGLAASVSGGRGAAMPMRIRAWPRLEPGRPARVRRVITALY